MTLNIRHVVAGEIVSTDSEFLDTLQAQLPAADDVTLGVEYTQTREEPRDDSGAPEGAEVLRARMTFAQDDTELTVVDGETMTVEAAVEQARREATAREDGEVTADDFEVVDTVDPAEEATQLFTVVAESDLATRADNWTLKHYLSPQRGVLADDVEEWYREHPDEQPTDDDGESFIPSAWDPQRHMIAVKED